MLDFGFYNMDCMEGMKEFPDNYFDLAIVDPPYGDAVGEFKGTDGTRFGGRFDKYTDGGGIANTADVTESGVQRTGGTWAAKFGKKSWRGTFPQNRNTLTNCFVFHASKLYGGGIIFHYRQHGVF